MKLTCLNVLGQYYGNGMEQLLLWRQLFSDSSAYMQIALMLCLFLVIVFKPERIRFPTRMKWSFLLLVAAVLSPTLMNLFLRIAAAGDMISFSQSSFRGQGSDSWLLQLPGLVGPMMLASSILMGFSSLWIGTAEAQAANKPTPPPKHPLDD